MRQHGVKSLMPEEAYQTKDYQWKYREDGN